MQTIPCDDDIVFSGSGSGQSDFDNFLIHTVDMTGKYDASVNVTGYQQVYLHCVQNNSEVCPEIDTLQPPNDTVMVVSCLYGGNPSLVMAGEAPIFVYEVCSNINEKNKVVDLLHILQQLIQSIVYYNNEDEPDLVNRTVTVSTHQYKRYMYTCICIFL